MIFIKLDKHVNEMMTTAGKKFQNAFFIKNILIKRCVCHQAMNVQCGQAAQKEDFLNMELLIDDSDVDTVL